MMAKSHVVVGVASWIAVAPLLHLSPAKPIYLALTVAGALLPDIDHPSSWVGRRSRPVSTSIAAMLGHRGITHSAVAVIGLVTVMVQLGYRHGVVAALAVGYLSHLAADMLTPRGLRLAWPFRATCSLPLCRTGSAVEPLIVLSLLGAIVWWIVRHGTHQPLIAYW